MILHPPSISSRAFSYHPEDNTFSAFASDLQDLRLGRVYDDAADEGFTMFSERTGREVVFARHHIEKDAEGDVRWEEFISVSSPFKNHFIVRIWNT